MKLVILHETVIAEELYFAPKAYNLLIPFIV